MTYEQLDLIIEFINKKCEIAVKNANGDGVSLHSLDRCVEIIGELEESVRMREG